MGGVPAAKIGLWGTSAGASAALVSMNFGGTRPAAAFMNAIGCSIRQSALQGTQSPVLPEIVRNIFKFINDTAPSLLLEIADKAFAAIDRDSANTIFHETPEGTAETLEASQWVYFTVTSSDFTNPVQQTRMCFDAVKRSKTAHNFMHIYEDADVNPLAVDTHDIGQYLFPADFVSRMSQFYCAALDAPHLC